MSTSISKFKESYFSVKQKNVKMFDDWFFNSIDWSTQFTGVEPFDENSVFHAELSHDPISRSPKDIPWKIRIGKGGQLYSLVIGESGQLVCPQWRNPSNSFLSPWNDDCMTGVVQSGDIHVSDEYMKHSDGFVHGSGMYIRPELDPLNNKPFYCPMLAEEFDSYDNSYMSANLGLIPKPSVNRPDVIWYHKYRDMGEGVLEITFHVYNFGDTTWKWSNLPWFAVKRSTLPDQLQGVLGSQYEKKEFKFGDYEVPSTFWITENHYSGWMAKTEDITKPSTSLTIGHVHGKKKHDDSEKFMARVGVAGPEVRDFQLFNHVWHNFNLPPRRSAFLRTFFVFGNLDHVAERCNYLVDSAEYGYPKITDSQRDLQLYKMQVNGKTILTKIKTDSPAFKVHEKPVDDSVPLFLLRNNSTQEYAVSTDPFVFSGKTTLINPYPESHERFERFQNRHIYKPYDGNTEWIELLGFVEQYEQMKLLNGYKQLSVLINDINFANGELKPPEELMS